MHEVGAVISNGDVIYWHNVKNNTSVFIPDDRHLWEVIWEIRDRLDGIAHSHPGGGIPSYSYEDVTTFAAIEVALGKRLTWWIISSDNMSVYRWCGPERLSYEIVKIAEEPTWIDELRRLSGYTA